MRSAVPALPARAVHLSILCVACLCAGVAGCRRHQAPTAPRSTAASAVEASAEWRARLACADCDAIDAQLVLQRGDRDAYVLTETYRTGNVATRFVEQGRWQRRDAVLRLRGDAGSARVYALLGDGRLQPRGSHGANLDPDADDALLPVSAEVAP